MPIFKEKINSFCKNVHTIKTKIYDNCGNDKNVKTYFTKNILIYLHTKVTKNNKFPQECIVLVRTKVISSTPRFFVADGAHSFLLFRLHCKFLKHLGPNPRLSPDSRFYTVPYNNTGKCNNI